MYVFTSDKYFSQMHDKTSRCDNSTATHSWMTCDKISER